MADTSSDEPHVTDPINRPPEDDRLDVRPPRYQWGVIIKLAVPNQQVREFKTNSVKPTSTIAQLKREVARRAGIGYEQFVRQFNVVPEGGEHLANNRLHL